jgi:hypothetical protein
MQGRDTTARALSYISGPDKPEPKQALIEAKRDRRKKNNARRVPSGGTDKSTNGQDEDNFHSANKDTVIDKDATTTSEDTNPPNTLDNAVTTSDKSTHARNEDTSSTVIQAKTVNDQDPSAKTSNTNGADEGKKSVGRRKWWQRRRGRGNKNKNDQDKVKENGTAQENTSGGQQDASKPDVTEDKSPADDKIKETPLGSTTNVAATAA